MERNKLQMLKAFFSVSLFVFCCMTSAQAAWHSSRLHRRSHRSGGSAHHRRRGGRGGREASRLFYYERAGQSRESSLFRLVLGDRIGRRAFDGMGQAQKIATLQAAGAGTYLQYQNGNYTSVDVRGNLVRTQPPVVVNAQPFRSQGFFRPLVGPIQHHLSDAGLQALFATSDTGRIALASASTKDALEGGIGNPKNSPTDSQECAVQGETVSSCLGAGFIDRYRIDRLLKSRRRSGINLYAGLDDWLHVGRDGRVTVTLARGTTYPEMVRRLENDLIAPLQFDTRVCFEEDDALTGRGILNQKDMPYVRLKRNIGHFVTQLPQFALNLAHKRAGFNVDDPQIHRLSEALIEAMLRLHTQACFELGIDTMVITVLGGGAFEHKTRGQRDGTNARANYRVFQRLAPLWARYNMKIYLSIPDQQTADKLQGMIGQVQAAMAQAAPAPQRLPRRRRRSSNPSSPVSPAFSPGGREIVNPFEYWQDEGPISPGTPTGGFNLEALFEFLDDMADEGAAPAPRATGPGARAEINTRFYQQWLEWLKTNEYMDFDEWMDSWE